MNKKDLKRLKKLLNVNDDNKIKKIQAMAEGGFEEVTLESLLRSTTNVSSIGGVENNYKNYVSQVSESYRKYNGESDFGNQQTRAIIDARTAFISGEGVSISTKNKRLLKFIQLLFKQNNFEGSNFIQSIKSGELNGRSVLVLKKGLEEEEYIPKIKRLIWNEYYSPQYDNTLAPFVVDDIIIRKNGINTKMNLKNFVYVHLGGDDSNLNYPTTKLGLVLNECENYDRALKDIRRLNHICARITPTFKATQSKEVKELSLWLSKSAWKIGQAFVGTADFDYKTPNTGAHQNLLTELVTTLKTISGVTGVPVHWLGWVDLMSNRSTADTLYESLKTATITERTIWSEAIYQLIIKAQEMHIDTGGSMLSKIERDFEVTIPLINQDKFKELVDSLSLAYSDGVISLETYRALLPSIDSIQESILIDKEEKENNKKIDRELFSKQELLNDEEDDSEIQN